MNKLNSPVSQGSAATNCRTHRGSETQARRGAPGRTGRAPAGRALLCGLGVAPTAHLTRSKPLIQIPPAHSPSLSSLKGWSSALNSSSNPRSSNRRSRCQQVQAPPPWTGRDYRARLTRPFLHEGDGGGGGWLWDRLLDQLAMGGFTTSLFSPPPVPLRRGPSSRCLSVRLHDTQESRIIGLA